MIFFKYIDNIYAHNILSGQKFKNKVLELSGKLKYARYLIALHEKPGAH